MRFQFIHAEKAEFPVVAMCRCLDVSLAGYYEWVGRGPSQRAQEDQKLTEALRESHAENRERYGSRRHRQVLNRRDIAIGRRRVGRLMREAELRAKRRRPYRCTTQADPTHSVAPNILARDFRPSRPDQAWASDITYLPTSEGWLYLAVVLDLFSRRVIGWSIGVRMTQRLALDALQMALRRRRAAPGLIHHSDRGSQYTAAAHRRLLTSRGIVCSMSRRGNCWDNAVAESFFATLETELLVDLRGRDREEVQQEVFRYVEGYYNRRRLHSTLGYLTPVEYEARFHQAEVTPPPTNTSEATAA